MTNQAHDMTEIDNPTAPQLRAYLRNHTGPVYMGTVAMGDVIPVQVVKADLLFWLDRLIEEQGPETLSPWKVTVEYHLHGKKSEAHLDSAPEIF